MRTLTVTMLALAASIGPAGCGGGDSATPHAGTPLTTSEEFDAKVVNSPRPALVDFYADWCGPCQKLKPVLVQLEAEYAGKIDFYRVDTDAARDLARKHGISGIPTLMLYHDGHMHQRMSGFKTAEELRQHLDALLAGH